MAYQYESLQNNLPTSVTPGWNDPPNLANAAPSTTTNRNHLKQMRTRPVHPSITGPSFGMGGYGQGAPQQNPYAAPQAYPQGTGQGYPAQNNTGQQQPINTQPYPQQPQQYQGGQPATGQYSPSAVGQQQPQQQFFSSGPSPSPVQISPSMNQSHPAQYSPSAVQQQPYPQQGQYQQPTHPAGQHYGMQGPAYSGQSSQPVAHPAAGYPAHPSANNMPYYPDQPAPQVRL